jgi:hypothetical protein
MKSTALNTGHSSLNIISYPKFAALTNIKRWLKSQEPVWQYNRLGISTVAIFLQVTFAGAMVSILAMAGASPFVYSTGILFSFMANSFAFAQLPMRWVLGGVMASIVLDVLLIIIYGLQLI